MFLIIAAFSAPVLRCNIGNYDTAADRGKPRISTVDVVLTFYGAMLVTVLRPAVKQFILLIWQIMSTVTVNVSNIRTEITLTCFRKKQKLCYIICVDQMFHLSASLLFNFMLL